MDPLRFSSVYSLLRLGSRTKGIDKGVSSNLILRGYKGGVLGGIGLGDLRSGIFMGSTFLTLLSKELSFERMRFCLLEYEVSLNLLI